MSFDVTVRTAAGVERYAAPANTAMDAFITAADAQGDTPCGITVTPAGPQQ